MKKIILLSIFLMSGIMLLCAQRNAPFFPATQGAKLETKTYDANNKLLYSMIYNVIDVTATDDEDEVTVNYILLDANDRMINEGQIMGSYDDGVFSMDMRNKSLIPDVLDLLGEDTELVGGLLDYPNTFDPNFPFDEDMQLEDMEYMLQSKSNKDEFLRVSIYDRQVHRNENITTPAGTFDAGKLTYRIKVEKGQDEMYYRATEWYTFGTGILRIEVTDSQNNLLNYTVLTSITE